jgi:hypothetical protein
VVANSCPEDAALRQAHGKPTGDPDSPSTSTKFRIEFCLFQVYSRIAGAVNRVRRVNIPEIATGAAPKNFYDEERLSRRRPQV